MREQLTTQAQKLSEAFIANEKHEEKIREQMQKIQELYELLKKEKKEKRDLEAKLLNAEL